MVYKSGYLFMKGFLLGKTKFWFAIKNDTLSWWKTAQDESQAALDVANLTKLVYVTEAPSKDGSFYFEVKFSSKTLLLCAQNETERAEWINALREANVASLGSKVTGSVKSVNNSNSSSGGGYGGNNDPSRLVRSVPAGGPSISAPIPTTNAMTMSLPSSPSSNGYGINNNNNNNNFSSVGMGLPPPPPPPSNLPLPPPPANIFSLPPPPPPPSQLPLPPPPSVAPPAHLVASLSNLPPPPPVPSSPPQWNSVKNNNNNNNAYMTGSTTTNNNNNYASMTGSVERYNTSPVNSVGSMVSSVNNNNNNRKPLPQKPGKAPPPIPPTRNVVIQTNRVPLDAELARSEHRKSIIHVNNQISQYRDVVDSRINSYRAPAATAPAPAAANPYGSSSSSMTGSTGGIRAFLRRLNNQ